MLPTRRLGTRTVGAIALGGARWALAPEPDCDLAIRTLRAAVDAGVNLLDTAPAYTSPRHAGLGEEVIGQSLGSALRSGELLVATKGGHWREGDSFPVDARPEILHRQCRESLGRLGVAAIDLYLLHWPDPLVPIEDSIGALGQLREQGLVRAIGVCNVDAEQLARAQTVTQIEAVQNRFSALDAESRPVLDACTRSGMTFLAYSPLGGPTGSEAMAARLPRFAAIARRMAVSVQEVCLAWLLAQAPGLIPVSGAGRPASITSAAHAAALRLSIEDLRDMEEDCPPLVIGQ